MTSAGPQIIQETNITTEGGDGSLSACKSLVIYLRFHQNENLLKFSRRRRLDDVLTTSHMRRTLARENFTSARRRRAISLSMLKVPIANHLTKLEFSTVNRVADSEEIGQVYTAPIREGNSTEIDSVFT